MRWSKVLISALAVAGCASAFAGTPVYDWVTTTASSGSGSKSTNKFYIGLNWRQGGGMTPAVVLGFMSAKTKSDGDTYGANLAFHTELAGGIRPGKLKLSYLDGKENVQGELGVGYDFLKQAPLVGLGVNAPYATAAIDGYWGHGVVPNITLHSLGKFDKPTQSTTSSTVCTNVGSGGRSYWPDCRDISAP